MSNTELNEKLSKLTAVIKGYSPLAIAFSGGVDSTFLLKHAHETLGDGAMAVTADAFNFAPDEIADAISFCAGEGIRHIIINLNDAFTESFADNPANRCYICKKEIFRTFLAHPELTGVTLVDGTNRDDTFDFRPGTKALAELGIKSPLLEAGFSKQDIRDALKEMGLPIWSKPAFACLASRVPYGERITPEKLKSVYSLEKLLRESGFSQVRVRHHGDVARIETLPSEREKFFHTDFMDKINEAAKEAGFIYASLDLGGYKTGNMNTFR